jgi:hypothetical protein
MRDNRRRLSCLEQLGAVFRRQRLGLFEEGGELLLAERRWRGGAGGDTLANLHEEVLLAGRRTDADQASRFGRGIVELVGSVGRNVDRFASVGDGLVAAESGFDLAFEDDEGFFKVVAVGTGPAAGRHVHVSDGDGVRISHEADVGQIVAVGVRVG